jgi:hypothetical protein
MTVTVPSSLVTQEDELTRLRRTALRLAYLSTSPHYAVACYTVDRLLEALNTHQPQEAATLLSQLRATRLPEIEVYALQQAQDLGFDTSDWDQRRADLDDMSIYSMLTGDKSKDLDTAAKNLWKSLADNHAPIAARLVVLLRALPDEWLQDYFHASRVEDIRPSGEDQAPPEAAPVGHYEDCPACEETDIMCRFHTGWADADDHTDRLMHLATQHPEGREIIAQRIADRALTEMDPLAAFTVVFRDEEVAEQLDALLMNERARLAKVEAEANAGKGEG